MLSRRRDCEERFPVISKRVGPDPFSKYQVLSCENRAHRKAPTNHTSSQNCASVADDEIYRWTCYDAGRVPRKQRTRYGYSRPHGTG